MTQISSLARQEGFGATARRDTWWIWPLLNFLGVCAFLTYGTWAAWQGNYFEIRQDVKDFHKANNPAVAPYLSPFFAPLIYDPQSHHAWIKRDLRPSWLPQWVPFSSGFLILAFPGIFRFTCYFYRKLYYRAFWADPIACAVGEPRKTYWGENRFPLILQNLHRYTMYIALILLVFLTWDALIAFWWPILDAQGNPTGAHRFGIGVGTIIMVVEVFALAAFVLGCNSVRHLVGGRHNCFSCPNKPEHLRPGYTLWRWSTIFNERHMEWSWISLYLVGLTDVYIRLCAMGILHDVRII